MENNIYTRTRMLIGDEALNKLKKAKIVLFGVGGVGSYVLEALVRSAYLNITIVDKDTIDESNLNRQVITNSTNVGEEKVKVAAKRAKEINKDINITALSDKLTKDNIANFISKDADYVIDAIDDFNAKIAIMEHCYNNNIKCISSMGMALRLNPLDIRVTDISKTTMCPLAKKVRKALKEKNILSQKVVYSIEQPIKINKEKSKEVNKIEEANETNEVVTSLGSMTFVPSTAGIIIASEITKDLIK